MVWCKTLRLCFSHLNQRNNVFRPHISNNILNSNPWVNGSYLQLHFVRKAHHASSPYQEMVEDAGQIVADKSKTIVDKVNNHIAADPGRLFAVIQICGKQYRVVNQDIILIERNWPPKINDRLIFEKVLLVGGSSFTLVGKPIIPRNIVTVTGTIVQKDLTHTKIRYYYIPKKRVHNLNFVREELTYIRINDIELHPKLNVMESTDYLRC